jgi:hypothetical protein
LEAARTLVWGYRTWQEMEQMSSVRLVALKHLTMNNSTARKRRKSP